MSQKSWYGTCLYDSTPRQYSLWHLYLVAKASYDTAALENVKGLRAPIISSETREKITGIILRHNNQTRAFKASPLCILVVVSRRAQRIFLLGGRWGKGGFHIQTQLPYTLFSGGGGRIVVFTDESVEHTGLTADGIPAPRSSMSLHMRRNF